MKEKDVFDDYFKIAISAFVLSILVFVCIYLFDVMNWPSKLGLVNSENSQTWLQYSIEFFGPIAASFIGFIGTIMAVLITITKQNEFRRDDSRKNVLPLIKVKNKVKSASLIYSFDGKNGENNRLDYPILDVLNEGETLLLINLAFKNVGQREMYEIWVGGVKYNQKESKNYYKALPILYKNDEYINCFSSAIKSFHENNAIVISFKVFFRDCYNNWYYQNIKGRGSLKTKSCFVDSFEVDSAPVLVRKNCLPKVLLGK